MELDPFNNSKELNMSYMQKTFKFDKVAYASTRRVNSPEVEVRLDYKDGDMNKPVLSIRGYIWNSTHTDAVICGQCLDEMAKLDGLRFNTLFRKLYRLWKLYHLNDLKNGGPLQEAALKDCKSSSYEEHCSYLESKGLLYEDDIKYGTKWWYHEIHEDDLKEIVSLLAE